MITALLASLAMSQAGWAPKHAPIETRWAKDVTPANALPDYPRPQLTRPRWQNLNGLWQFETGAARPKAFGRKILVPYAVETAASGIMEHHDRLWYRRTFTVPAAWKGGLVRLHFEGVDYEAEVFVNGKSLGVHRGGYEPFDYNVGPYLKGKGPQELVVRVFDPTEAGGQPRGKQTTRPGGIMYTPTSGIWQTVWLESLPEYHIENLKIVPDVDHQAVRLTVNGVVPDSRYKVLVTIRDGNRTVKTVKTDVFKPTSISLPNPKLWSPSRPFLYDLDVRLTDASGRTVVDRVGSYFGMRKISLGKVGGVTKMLLNGKFEFQIGPLDQGYWPESGLTPPTEAAMKNDLQTMKRLGFNMVRKHIKVEPARWYYWTDRLGLLVWQDMPSPNSYTENPPPIDKAAFEKQIENVVATHGNAPSIVMWVVFNEEQARHDTAKLVAKVKALDPTRLVNRDSGGGNDRDGREGEVGDVDDVHSYPPPNVPGPSANQALACGEYGGLGFIVAGHTWQKRDNWGYAVMPSRQDLVETYAQYMAKLKRFRDENGLSAAVYTQITDVEIESNGLMTYDRVLKVDPAQIALANRFAYPFPTIVEVVPTSEKTKQTWRYTFDKPSDDWTAKTFDDAAWRTGPGGFGRSVAPGNPLGTPWNTADIWMRRTFALPKLSPAALAQLCVRDCHDEDVEVWINGVKAYAASGYISDYEVKAISPAARAALVPGGVNTLAVRCRQTAGGQFVDVGLARKIPAKR